MAHHAPLGCYGAHRQADAKAGAVELGLELECIALWKNSLVADFDKEAVGVLETQARGGCIGRRDQMPRIA